MTNKDTQLTSTEGAEQTEGNKKPKPLVFSFGDPETTLSTSIIESLGTFLHHEYASYEPPVSQSGLAKLFRANAYHSSVAYFKRNMVMKYYPKDYKYLPWKDARKIVLDYMIFAQCYAQRIENRWGHLLYYRHVPAINMRRLKEKGRFCQLQPNLAEPLKFKAGEIVQLMEYDLEQQIYGIPEYFAALQSILLNEDATLFRRKYYVNGAHMGYIFYTANPNIEEEDEDLLKEQITASKGAGNFRSMYINIPEGGENSVQIIPVGDISTKDEFEKVKNATRNDILAAWRVNGALAGILPENAGGFGDIEKIDRINHENEVIPMQDIFLQFNEFLPANAPLEFREPDFKTAEKA